MCVVREPSAPEWDRSGKSILSYPILPAVHMPFQAVSVNVINKLIALKGHTNTGRRTKTSIRNKTPIIDTARTAARSKVPITIKEQNTYFLRFFCRFFAVAVTVT